MAAWQRLSLCAVCCCTSSQAAASQQLPASAAGWGHGSSSGSRPAGLEHLSITNSAKVAGCHLQLSGIKLRKLQQLTYLHLQQRTELQRQGPDSDRIKLHHLSALTRLSDLRLSLSRGYSISASMLSASQHLTHLQLEMNAVRLKQSALAGRTQLQHMDLQGQRVSGDAAGAAQWLSELQPLQQLTCLEFSMCSTAFPPAAADSALTASTKLQHMKLGCCLPAGMWQHMFPAGRQLPHLHVLSIEGTRRSQAGFAAAPTGTQLVGCCPGLQALTMWGLPCSTELMGALRGLSSLTSLSLSPPWRPAILSEALPMLQQLTRLRRLRMALNNTAEELLLQLPQLRQLTHFFCLGCMEGHLGFFSHVGDYDPQCQVWGIVDC